MDTGNRITIVGAGLVGALEAVFLSKRGFNVHLFERRGDIRADENVEGRSINLALSQRGWRALEQVGIADDIRKIAIPMYKRTMHDLLGNLSYQPYGLDNQAIYSVSRAELNKALLTLAEQGNRTMIQFHSRCTDLNLEEKKIFFRNDRTGQDITQSYETLFGTDGAYSAVRHRLMFNDRFDYRQYYIEHGYKELSIEPAEDGSHQLEKNTLHIWPRKEFMLIALPNIDGSFTCTLFFPFDGPLSFSTLRTEPEVTGFFQLYFPDLVPLIPDLLQQYYRNPVSSLVTINCGPWNHKDEVLLLGDAAHAVVPFYGQGMNAGFEDCFLLDQISQNSPTGPGPFFDEFSRSRRPDTDAIAELALRNFVEMRDLTADPNFLLRKKIETWFASRHPDKWTPLYSMVTFSDLPYSVALRESENQDHIMSEIMKLPDIADNWNSALVEEKLLKLIG